MTGHKRLSFAPGPRTSTRPFGRLGPAWVTVTAMLLLAGSASWAGTVRNLTNLPNDDSFHPRQAALDDAGSVVYTVSSTNPFGTNPRHSWQIFGWDPASGTGWQVTSFEKGVEIAPSDFFSFAVSSSLSVSDDGQWLAFISCSDLVGMNHDGSSELYAMRPDGSGIVQLTTDPAVDAGTVYGAMISGSGNRVVFVANTDPLGTNPGHHKQLFVVDLDGTGLRQLTSALTDPGRVPISISDDGNRIVFSHMENLSGENPNGLSQIFAIEADGTGLRQLSHMTSGSAGAPVLSGNGAAVVFEKYSGGFYVSKVNWDGTGSVEIANAEDPSITDDGQMIFYRDSPSYHIWKVRADGTGNTELTTTSGYYPVVSGDGSRVVFWRGSIMAMDSAGGNLRQLTTDVAIGYGYEPQVTDDGTRVFFLSEQPGISPNVFRIQADGTGLAQVTNISDWYAIDFAASSDGSVVVFSWYTVNGPVNLFKINADGTGMTQLTPTPSGGVDPYDRFPVISSDGQWVIFQSVRMAGLNTDGYLEVLRIRLDGTQLWSVTNDDDMTFSDKLPRVSDGSVPWIVYQSASNKDGLNADGSLEIFRVRLTGTPARLTADPMYDSMEPDISANGSLIVYASEADPLGTNPDHNDEIFLYEVPTASRRQLTFTPSGASYKPRISRDGTWVYFRSSAPFFEPNRDGHYEPYRLSVATGVVERLGGTRCCGASLYEYDDAISVDRAGTRVAFTGIGDWNDQNPDRTADVYLVDFAARPTLHVGEAAPTLVSWDPEPKPVRYDVIRGDLASVGPGAGGSVDLGAVACIEDNSPDTSTSGFEDALQPASGRVLFYLYRGTQGLADLPGSWGQGSGGSERSAGVGACAP